MTEAVKTVGRFLETLAGRETRRAGEPGWLCDLRERRLEAFSARGFPSRKTEDWRHTDTRAIAEGAFLEPPRIERGRLPDALTRAIASAACGSPQIQLVNGSRTDGADAPRGVSVRTFVDLFSADPDALRSLLESFPEEYADTPFALLNTACLTGGLWIDVAPGVRDARLELVIAAYGDSPVQHHPRIVVTVGRDAQLSLVETHVCGGSPGHLQNLALDIRLAENARMVHERVGEDEAALHVETVLAALDRDSHYESAFVTFGGALVRSDYRVRLAGPGAHAALHGLYVLDGNDHADHHTVIDHAVANTTSFEHYKGILGGRSRGAFLGRIVVREDAQQINAEQKNNNLLVSDEALVHSTPQLEIYADDVQCSHGSTVGQLDDDMLFYLRARGIGIAEARQLLTYAFANELLDRLRTETLRLRLSERMFGSPEREHVEIDG